MELGEWKDNSWLENSNTDEKTEAEMQGSQGIEGLVEQEDSETVKMRESSVKDSMEEAIKFLDRRNQEGINATEVQIEKEGDM